MALTLEILAVQKACKAGLKKKKVPPAERAELNARLLRCGLAEIAIQRNVSAAVAYDYVVGKRESLP